jgi:hypothetical protein
MKDGTSLPSNNLVHLPCSKCGEPRLLLHMVWGVIFFIVLSLSVTGGCVYYGATMWPHNNDKNLTEKMYTIGGLLVGWLILMIVVPR